MLHRLDAAALQVELNMATKMKNTEHRRIQDALVNVTKEKDNLLKRYKKMENIIKVSSAILPGLESQKHEHQMRVYQQNTLLVRQRQVRQSQCNLTAALSCAAAAWE